MKLKEVAKTCLEMVEHREEGWPEEGHLSKPHIMYLLESVMDGSVISSQANRWIGWAQAAMYSTGMISLDDLKIINKSDGKYRSVREHEKFGD